MMQAGNLHEGSTNKQNRVIYQVTSQDKLRSLYPKEQLIISHECGLGMKSPILTREKCFAICAANQFPQQTQTPLTYALKIEKTNNYR